jgi:hypothetical protein
LPRLIDRFNSAYRGLAPPTPTPCSASQLSTLMYLALYILIFSSIYKSSLPTNESRHSKKLTHQNNQKRVEIEVEG